MPERGQGPIRAGEAGADLPPAPAGGLPSSTRGLTAERYRSVFDSLHEGMAYCRMIFDGDRPVDWLYLEVNPAFSELTGLRDVAGRRVSEVVPQLREQHPEIFATYGRVVTTGVPEQFEAFVRPLETWLSISVSRPEPGCFVALFEDRTERMRAESQLRESLAHLEAMMESAPDAMLVNRGDRVVLANAQALRLFGAREASEIVGRRPLDLVHPDGRAAARQRIERMRETGAPAPLMEQQIVRLDGTVVDVEVAAAPFSEAGQFAIHVTMRDSSLRKAAEARAHHQEAMLREAGQLAQVGGWEFDPATGEGSWTEEVARIHDLDPAERTSQTIGLGFFEGESRARIESALAAAIEHGTPYDLELELVSATGRRKQVRTICHPETRDGRVVRVRGSLQDISARVAVERALAGERSRLRTVIDTIPDKVWLKDPEGVYLGCNPAFERMIGRQEAEIVGRTDFDFFPSEVAEEFRRHDRAAIAAGKPTVNEEWVHSATDGPELLETIKTPVLDPDGRLVGALGIARDVTEARATAESLRQSEAHYRALAETTFDWIWEVDSDGRYTFVSPRVTQLLGYSPEEVLGKVPFDFMPEAEALRVRELFDGFVERREPFAGLENVNRHRDGRRIVLESSGVPFFDGDGQLRGYRGMDRDITARKQAERRSATQAAVSRVLAEASSLADAAPGVLAAIGTSEGWLCGALWEIDDERRRLRSVATWASAGCQGERFLDETRTLHLAEGEGFPGSLWRSGRVEVWREISANRSFLRGEAAAAAGLQAAIGFPIRFADEVLGVVEFLGSAITAPEPELVEVFDALGQQLGQFVERTRSSGTIARFVAGSPAVIYALRVLPEGLKLAWFSANLENMTGWPAVEIEDYTWWLENIHPDDRARVLSANSVPYGRGHQVTDFRFRHKDGRYLWIRDEKRLLLDRAGNPSEVVGSWTDITSRVELEEQLRVAQKLEAIGRLAGGVAHDFNNMLTVIGGNSEMLARKLPPESGELALLHEIRETTDRAAALTRQLLAFSRSQVLAPRVTELGGIVERVESMLRRLIGEDIRLICHLSQDAGFVEVDPGQLEQVIVNLAVNARDAMPRGGTLSLATAAVELSAERGLSRAGLPPGRYARLTVTDTGCGMSPEVRERIFEPFFTTKPAGSGTGLGLATVFGIVQQSGGGIEVDSTPGVGTSFEIYLPQVTAPAPAIQPTASSAVPSRGHETVLLVEDEAGVRRVARMALERQGYTVLAAASGREAIELADRHREAIDLLLTDLVMPELNGRELAESLRARYPDLAVVMMSGYVEDDFVRHGVVTDEVAFLHKPFTLAQLAQKVRETLDAPPA